MPEIIENRDVFSGGSQVVVGSDYRFEFLKLLKRFWNAFRLQNYCKRKSPEPLFSRHPGK